MSSTRPSLLGYNTHTHTHTHRLTNPCIHTFSKLKANYCFCVCRLLIGLEYALLVWWTPSVKQDGGFPVYYYAIVLVSYALHQVCISVTLFNILFFSLFPASTPALIIALPGDRISATYRQ